MQAFTRVQTANQQIIYQGTSEPRHAYKGEIYFVRQNKYSQQHNQICGQKGACAILPQFVPYCLSLCHVAFSTL